jgi:hypothetical protein
LIASGPVLDEAGGVWVLTNDGMLHHLHNAAMRQQIQLPEQARGGTLQVSAGHVSVLRGSRLSVFASDGKPLFIKDSVRWAAASAEVVISAEQQLYWINPQTGAVLGAPLQVGELSDAPLVFQAHAFLPMADGSLWRVGREGKPQFCRIASGPLFTPRVDFATETLLATAGSGVISAVRAKGQE